MIPGCTHAIGIELLDHSINLNNAAYVYVTIAQREQLKTFKSDRIEIGPTGYDLTIYLTQEESLSFGTGAAQLQVNWLESNGRARSDGQDSYERFASDVVTVAWNRQLLTRLLPLKEEQQK